MWTSISVSHTNEFVLLERLGGEFLQRELRPGRAAVSGRELTAVGSGHGRGFRVDGTNGREIHGFREWPQLPRGSVGGQHHRAGATHDPADVASRRGAGGEHNPGGRHLRFPRDAAVDGTLNRRRSREPPPECRLRRPNLDPGGERGGVACPTRDPHRLGGGLGDPGDGLGKRPGYKSFCRRHWSGVRYSRRRGGWRRRSRSRRRGRRTGKGRGVIAASLQGRTKRVDGSSTGSASKHWPRHRFLGRATIGRRLSLRRTRRRILVLGHAGGPFQRIGQRRRRCGGLAVGARSLHLRGGTHGRILLTIDGNPQHDGCRCRRNRHDPFDRQHSPPWTRSRFWCGARHRREHRLAPRAPRRVVFRSIQSLARQRAIHPRGKRFRVDTRVRGPQVSAWLQPPPQKAVDRSVALVVVLTHLCIYSGDRSQEPEHRVNPIQKTGDRSQNTGCILFRVQRQDTERSVSLPEFLDTLSPVSYLLSLTPDSPAPCLLTPVS
jgi:hypothetical protein